MMCTLFLNYIETKLKLEQLIKSSVSAQLFTLSVYLCSNQMYVSGFSGGSRSGYDGESIDP